MALKDLSRNHGVCRSWYELFPNDEHDRSVSLGCLVSPCECELSRCPDGDAMSEFHRTTIFRAVKRPDGKVVCVDTDYLQQTTKVVATEGEYLILKGQGWTDDPQSAMDRFEEEEQALGRAAAERAYTDQTMSEAAQAEAVEYEKTTSRHVPEIPEVARKRGRPKKVVLTDGEGA